MTQTNIEHRQKPDLPLRLLSRGLKVILGSPLGSALLGISRRFFNKQEENWFDLTRLALTLPRLKPEFHGYRIAQISDFHIGTWITRQHLEETIETVNRMQPDLVAITGDFVTFRPEQYAADLTAVLSKLSPRDAVVAVLGNHDHWSNPVVIRRVLKACNIVELSNRVHTLQRGNARLHIAGVDDYMDELDRLDRVLDRLNGDEEAVVLLAHEPDFADISAQTGRFSLQISGHSHGGQIRLPWIGPPLLPRYARKYPAGLYKVKGMHLYTNRGLGTAEFQLRWNCRPEITLFTLLAPEN